ncbi:MAG: hypothetical protein WCG55_00250 [bacterium]
MKTMDKKWWWVIGGAVVLVIVIIGALRLSHKAEAPVAEPSTHDLETSVLQSTEDFSRGSVHQAPAPTVPALTYTEALTKYADARLEFDAECQVRPVNQTWKNNTELMLDNRSNQNRLIHMDVLGDVTIKPWGFKIVKFSSPTTPDTIMVDCGNLQNVTSVLLQK